MRRFSAILLLALFGPSLISPLLSASDADSRLPACCRRYGKHRCSMVTSNESSGVPALQASRCPSYPDAQAVPASPRSVVTPIVTVAFQAPIYAAPIRPSTRSLHRAALARAQQERAPPASVS